MKKGPVFGDCNFLVRQPHGASSLLRNRRVEVENPLLGRRIDRVLETTLTFRPTHFEVATGNVRIHGTLVDVDPATGRATAIRRLVVQHPEADPFALLARRQEEDCPSQRGKL